jgi:hypothetical protein
MASLESKTDKPHFICPPRIQSSALLYRALVPAVIHRTTFLRLAGPSRSSSRFQEHFGAGVGVLLASRRNPFEARDLVSVALTK